MTELHTDRAGDAVEVWFDEANQSLAIGTRRREDDTPPAPVWIDVPGLYALCNRLSGIAGDFQLGVMP